MLCVAAREIQHVGLEGIMLDCSSGDGETMC